MKPIRIAVADDSSFVRRALVRLLDGHERLTVVGAAASGEELLANLDAWRPDVITLDLAMPGMGGLATLDRLVEISEIPVIIFSTHSGQGAPQTIEALHRGAVDFIDKQRYSMVDFEALRQVLVEKILQVSHAPAGKPGVRKPAAGRASAARPAARRPRARPARPAGPRRYRGGARLLAIGASTGGPPAIQRILEDLGPTLPVPVAVAQHMPEGFTRAFASRLNSHLTVAVREVTDGELLAPGTVYIAPATFHLTFTDGEDGLRAAVDAEPTTLPHRPSVDRLFASAARVLGGDAIALLLTGMGSDGSAGMVELHRAGAYTLAQDEVTSVVYSMPGSAVKAGAVTEVLPLDRLGLRVRELLARRAAG